MSETRAIYDAGWFVLTLPDGTRARFYPATATLLATGEGWRLYKSKTDRFVLLEDDEGEETACVIDMDMALSYLEEGQRTQEGEQLLAEHVASLPEV